MKNKDHKETAERKRPEERRSGMRVKLDDLAVLTTREKEEKPIIVKDISRRGLCVEANFPLRTQEAYQVTLQSALFQVEAKKNFKCVWCLKSDESLWKAGLSLDRSAARPF